MSIPKIIMQTWKTRDVPDKWKKSPESIKWFMPEWKHVLMTDTDNRQFIQDYFPDFLSYYDGFKYNIQRADAVRYAWLYINGGLYLDLDIELIKPLDSLFNLDGSMIYLASSRTTPRVTTNMLMASTPGHPFWLDCIEEMKKSTPWWTKPKHYQVLYSTGPQMVTRVLQRTNYTHVRLPANVLGYGYTCSKKPNFELYTIPITSVKHKVPSIPGNDQLCWSKYALDVCTIPLQGSSWIDSSSAMLYDTCYCYQNPLAFIAVLLIVLIIVMIIVYFAMRP